MPNYWELVFIGLFVLIGIYLTVVNKTKQLTSIGNLLDKYGLKDSDKYVSQEFQKYAYELAKELDDLPHKSLYMRLAKNTPRGLMESSRSFVKDAVNAKSKGRLFMWKLGELKKESVRKSKTTS